ncbi:MAG: hypothetical protein ACT4N4_05750 [Rhodospirillales bacterium]
MQRKIPVFAAAVLLALVAPLAAPMPVAGQAAAAGNCEPGDKPDNSTAADAKKKIEAAGYAQVRDLKKGCDNVWHAKAAKGAQAVNVALTPQGQVFLETD